MTVVSATLLIPSVLIFHFLLAALYLAQSSHHPSCSHPFRLLCIALLPPSLLSIPLCWHAWGEGGGRSIRSSSLSPAVALADVTPSGCRVSLSPQDPWLCIQGDWQLQRGRSQTVWAARPHAHLSLILLGDWWGGTLPVTQIIYNWIAGLDLQASQVMLIWIQAMTEWLINITWQFYFEEYEEFSTARQSVGDSQRFSQFAI